MLLIDTDPGVDDAHAIAIAASRVPSDQLIFTTVAGNVPIDAVTANTQWLVARLCPGAKIYRGAALPVLGQADDAAHIHGVDGLAGIAQNPVHREPLTPGHAALAIVEAAREHGKDLRIAALGPLTNIAIALQIEPDLPNLIGGFYCMGGSPRGLGNASVNAEFNIWVDPIAADIVFERMSEVTLITWDATLDTEFTAAEMESMWASGSRAARLIADMNAGYVSKEVREKGDAARFASPDPIAMAVLLDPSLITSSARRRIHVGTDTSLARGATIVDWADATSDREPVNIATSFNREALIRALAV